MHRKKLSALYGANVFVPSVDSSIINLSDYTLDEDKTSLLNLGLGFGVKLRVSTIHLQVQMEKLYVNLGPQESESRHNCKQ